MYRLAQLSVNIIDQCVAQGVPFAREYGGLLDNRSFGGAQVSRTFYARGQTGQQLLLGAYQALLRQVHLGDGHALPPHRDARRRGPRGPGGRRRHPRPDHRGRPVPRGRRGRARHRRVRQRLLPLDERQAARNVTAIWRAHKPGRADARTPATRRSTRRASRRATTSSRKLTLMSESLRNDGRIWVPDQLDDQRAARPDPGGRARLLPRAPLPGVREPRAPRRRVARRQARGATRAAASGR